MGLLEPKTAVKYKDLKALSYPVSPRVGNSNFLLQDLVNLGEF